MLVVVNGKYCCARSPGAGVGIENGKVGNNAILHRAVLYPSSLSENINRQIRSLSRHPKCIEVSVPHWLKYQLDWHSGQCKKLPTSPIGKESVKLKSNKDMICCKGLEYRNSENFMT